MEETNVFTAKTVDEAIEAGLKSLNITREQAEITVLEEGRKKLFGSIKAKVQIVKKANKASEAQKAADFIDKLMEILKISAVSEIEESNENIKIDIKATDSAKVIGKRGDVLDAIQCIAGAVANIGREKYIKVVVDCENYRTQREKTLKELAEKLAKKAVEKGRKMTLEPMNPYERRIIHSALSENSEVKTISEGKEPNRYIAVIPNNAKPYDKGLRYGGRGERGRDARHGAKDERRRDFKRNSGNRSARPSGGSGAKRGKKEIYFGAFLGNSGAKPQENEEDKE